MSFISSIRYIKPDDHRVFVAERLKALKEQLDQDIKAQTDEESLRLATWNIMHFSDGGAYDRTTESLLYIAEIIDHFDLVAIQEVNHDLRKFELLMQRYLGGDWDYILTDASGNRERLAYAYRKSKVRFLREAGEIVLPEGQEIVAPGQENATRKLQFARTPFAVTFQAGWFRFKLCTVHIYYGKSADNSPEMDLRRSEIEKIAVYLANVQKAEKRSSGTDANMILLGDFNIVSPEHRTMKALLDAGFITTEGIRDAATSLSGKHHYDQIVFKLAEKRVKLGASGVLNIFKSVYRSEDAAHYATTAEIKTVSHGRDGAARAQDKAMDYFRNYYRKHQLSDHNLLWCEIKTDFSGHYLDAIAAGKDPRAM
ncbi:MAG: endonuclease/exonuclease/phosphatase family protein [Hoeflea sp.]|uniref:endonuclease/exonuclease/phosphatase family protein n=1 Tax=Hoeflea sp. TaxID=1940281 RepID=UPI001DC869B7|nr:endonuclease/exonuclease/phosphatase family protein [Hoeflea sp.]MBU4529163.1 endonuclease/exonuclease/phosphatase family protein [Alphaproteobacteria bacterium]MBU4543568.1 endonuclease/exonuclease/phosphatase family protein [Alphaproteobacteria bacterium]MBU4549193.1 endonuclease/exonuclease/phosphatase family protein [Alphaproteobacteria bacterium]MBV1725328.1 endonuclease/exonuclease/phosphatase family protein [Hoeflea sp.]MBV1785289.1 endonuclease/exonuclease/phosphatase family protein